MQMITGNLWNVNPPNGGIFDARVITTNGVLNSNGEAVMGVGTALQAARMFPTLPKLLGKKLDSKGNKVFRFSKDIFSIDYDIVTFPTKEDWRDPSDMKVIWKSTIQLLNMADSQNWKTVALPKVGTGAGGLQWKNVKSLIKRYLDDRFFVISYE